jgi:Ca-activated chloride channel family protein
MPFQHAFAGGIVLSVVAVAGLAARQDPPPVRFSSQVQLVEVYATVIDSKGEPVTGLSRDDFEVYEDGMRQEISAFAAGEFPLTAVLGVDRSWSMAGDRLRLAKQASQSFIRALRTDDRTMVMAINNEAEIVAPLTMDRAGQIRAIEGLDPWSTTALHDSLITALDRLEGETGRQAIVVFSDGVDRYSQASSSDVVERARRSNSLIYPIAFGRERPAVLAELAVVTGGRSFLLRDVKELDKTLADIARELRHQYLIGYTPSPAVGGAPGWRSIRVTTRTPGLRVRARDGYMSDDGDLH